MTDKELIEIYSEGHGKWTLSKAATKLQEELDADHLRGLRAVAAAVREEVSDGLGPKMHEVNDLRTELDYYRAHRPKCG